ncbi:hypothetical protein EXIGLDRAFT_776059 [Exidia glandulosa HHB12029]|uniref:Uncharacterized protein n=1 Tax=Exidia glandulosa HHB12029 TaxID=1314781 RepID=A0A165DMN9_EXIGL|nr:hypothetical protein EXIGLDRAFT_776059 [Exidia glandulosa HHB12029]
MSSSQVASMDSDVEPFDDTRMLAVRHLREIGEEISSRWSARLTARYSIPLAVWKMTALEQLDDQLKMMKTYGYISREDYLANVAVLLVLARQVKAELNLWAIYGNQITVDEVTRQIYESQYETTLYNVACLIVSARKKLEKCGNESIRSGSQLKLYAGGAAIHVFN